MTKMATVDVLNAVQRWPFIAIKINYEKNGASKICIVFVAKKVSKFVEVGTYGNYEDDEKDAKIAELKEIAASSANN